MEVRLDLSREEWIRLTWTMGRSNMLTWRSRLISDEDFDVIKKVYEIIDSQVGITDEEYTAYAEKEKLKKEGEKLNGI